jgi:hypothetical protein
MLVATEGGGTFTFEELREETSSAPALLNQPCCNTTKE